MNRVLAYLQPQLVEHYRGDLASRSTREYNIPSPVPTSNRQELPQLSQPHPHASSHDDGNHHSDFEPSISHFQQSYDVDFKPRSSDLGPLNETARMRQALDLENTGVGERRRGAAKDREVSSSSSSAQPGPTDPPDLTGRIVRLGLAPMATGGYSSVWRGNLPLPTPDNSDRSLQVLLSIIGIQCHVLTNCLGCYQGTSHPKFKWEHGQTEALQGDSIPTV
jgi:hypothetical protein